MEGDKEQIRASVGMLVAVPTYTKKVYLHYKHSTCHLCLLDAIFVRLIHWLAPVDVDQPSIDCGSSDFAAKKMPEKRPALAMCCAPKLYTLHGLLQRCTTFKQIEMRQKDVLVRGNVTQKMMLHKFG
jgi:hypothetical protein